jgi:methylenetetrahydrofolate dehydrogenase (NADP+)/methenyltetrahydrofolate cyclohydrolase
MTKIEGTKIAEELQEKIGAEIRQIEAQKKQLPGLTVIIVGENPASRTYVKKKHQTALKLGIRSQVEEFDNQVSRTEIVEKIDALNRNKHVHAILIQLPLPAHFDTWEILEHLNPAKDVDCFLPVNLGKILLNRTDIFPCTPAGVMFMLDYHKIDLNGLNTVMAGRSFIVGKPLAGMLTNKNATVTLCHSKTENLEKLTREADLVVAAIGKPGVIRPEMVKKGAILIDVGQNFLTNRKEVMEFCNPSQQMKFEKKGYGITGDIHIEAFKKASYYTPVPGGVGPMTVAMLMSNTLTLFKQQIGAGI